MLVMFYPGSRAINQCHSTIWSHSRLLQIRIHYPNPEVTINSSVIHPITVASRYIRVLANFLKKYYYYDFLIFGQVLAVFI